MVDHKMFVYNAARDNNLAALKVSVLLYVPSLIDCFCVFACDWNYVPKINEFGVKMN